MASFAWSGHGAEGGIPRLAAHSIHLLTAGIWGGALLSLFWTVQAARAGEIPADLVLRGLNAFSRIGVIVVLLLAASGVINVLPAVADFAGLAQSRYGLVLGMKLLLFSGMLALAALHRYRLTPRLAQPPSTALQETLAVLHRSLAAETLLAILVLALAAYMGSIAPPS
jgi:putative copper resistance protein D